MRKVMLLVLALLPMVAQARPDTHALLVKQTDAVKLQEQDGIYRIEICPTNKCDSFESSSSSTLDDYVYLYSVYVGRFPDFTTSSPDGRPRPMAFATSPSTRRR